MIKLGVYTLTDPSTSMFYVGSSQDIDKRVERHFNELKKGIHHCKPLQDLWNKGHNFTVAYFLTVTREEAYVLEQDIIDRRKDEMLNVGLGVRGGDNLTRNPNREEIINKIRAGLENVFSMMTYEERKQIWGRTGEKNSMFGKSHSPEAIEKMSQAAKGHTRNIGRKLSQEQVEGMRIRGRTWVGEKNPFYGKAHSEETKKILSLANAGKLPPNTLKVAIDGDVYESLTEAGRKLNVCTTTIHNRVNNPRFLNYSFVTECPTTSCKA